MRTYILCLLMMILTSCSAQDQEALQELTKALILLGTLSGILPAILIILAIYGIKALAGMATVEESKPYDPNKAKHRKWEALMNVPDSEKDPKYK